MSVQIKDFIRVNFNSILLSLVFLQLIFSFALVIRCWNLSEAIKYSGHGATLYDIRESVEKSKNVVLTLKDQNVENKLKLDQMHNILYMLLDKR